MLDFKSFESINTTKFECNYVNAPYASCSQLLSVQHSKENAAVTFEATPSETLILSNVPQIITNTTMIWLNKIQYDRTIQISCFQTDACKEDTINDIYTEIRSFQFHELWANLLTRLYDTTVKPESLTCADNDDKPVKCPYGYCQLISNDLTSFSRRCVSNSSMPNPYGVIIKSKTITETDIESTVMYTCNKPMCNNLPMAKEVKQLLEVRKVLLYSITTTTTTTTTTTAPKTTKPSTGNIAKPLISLQCGLIFLMTFLFLY